MMNNLESIQILEQMRMDYTGKSQEIREALSVAIDTIKLRIPRPPINITARCPRCSCPIKLDQKVCENCGQWILWRNIEE